VKITVRLLGYLGVELGHNCVGLEVPEGAHLSDAVSQLVRHIGPTAGRVLVPSHGGGYNVLFSVNGRPAVMSSTLSDGDELILFPPSAGGEQARSLGGFAGDLRTRREEGGGVQDSELGLVGA
jgi:molybdopterin converting factor small subunit